MSDLLPCPMCGEPLFIQVRWIGFTHTHNGAFDAGYRGECCECGLTTRAFNTEAEAKAAWDTRAPYKSERTCKPVEKDGVMRCSDCDYPLGIMSVPAYCAGCGAKVVSE